MRAFIAVAGVAVAFGASATSAFGHNAGLARKNNHLRAAVIKLHGRRAPGCDLLAGRCRGHKHPSMHAIHRYLDTLRGLVMPAIAARYVTTGAPYQAPAGTASINPGGALQRIAGCESGGNPHAVSPSGAYRGLLQFDYQTWRSVGGTGDPAMASAAEQYKRGAMLYAQRGSAPWPVCGA